MEGNPQGRKASMDNPKGKEVVVNTMPRMEVLGRAHNILYGVKGTHLILDFDMAASGKHEIGKKNDKPAWTEGFGVKIPGTNVVFQGHIRIKNDEYDATKDSERIKKAREEAKALGFTLAPTTETPSK